MNTASVYRAMNSMNKLINQHVDSMSRRIRKGFIYGFPARKRTSASQLCRAIDRYTYFIYFVQKMRARYPLSIIRPARLHEYIIVRVIINCIHTASIRNGNRDHT